MRANFLPHDNVFDNGHVTIFSSSMHIYLRCQTECLMSTFQYLLSSSCSIQSLVVPTRRMIYLLIKICSSPMVLYLVNQFTSFERVCTATDRKLCWFCLLRRLTMTFSLSASLLQRTVSDMVFKTNNLRAYDFFRFHGSANRTSDMSTGRD